MGRVLCEIRRQQLAKKSYRLVRGKRTRAQQIRKRERYFGPKKGNGVDVRGKEKRYMAFKSGWLHYAVNGNSLLETVGSKIGMYALLMQLIQ